MTYVQFCAAEGLEILTDAVDAPFGAMRSRSLPVCRRSHPRQPRRLRAFHDCSSGARLLQRRRTDRERATTGPAYTLQW
jgi:hypothetical protein